MKLQEIPHWLKKSELYRNLSENDGEFDEKIINTPEVNNMKDFKKVYKVSSKWMLDQLPIDLYVFGFLNKNKVFKFLKKLETNESKILYEDISKDTSFKRYKNYIIDNYKDEKITEFFNVPEYFVTLKIESSEEDEIQFNQKYEDVHDNIEDIYEFRFIFTFINENDEIIALQSINLSIKNNYLESRVKTFEKFLKSIKSLKSSRVSYESRNSSVSISYKKNRIIFDTTFSQDGENVDSGMTEIYLNINDSIIEKLNEMYTFMKINKLDGVK